MYLFVYGTLKSNYPANALLQRCGYVGPALIEGHTLLDLTYYPGVVECMDPDAKVFGELYSYQEDKDIQRARYYEGSQYAEKCIPTYCLGKMVAATVFVLKGAEPARQQELSSW